MSIIRLRENMQNWFKYVIILLAVVFAVGWAGLSIGNNRLAQKGGSAGGNGVIARVNGENIDARSFEGMVAQQIQKDAVLTPIEAMQTRGRIFDSMVDELVMVQAANKEGIKVSRGDLKAAREKAVDAQFEQLKQQVLTGYSGKDTEKYIENFLKKQNLTIKELRSKISDSIDNDKLKKQVLLQKLGEQITSNIDASDSAIKASFDQFQISRITISTAKRSPAEAESMVNNIATKLKVGGDFATLAKQYSEDPLKSKGGAFAQYIGKGMMEPEVDALISTLAVGQISDPIKTGQGYVIVMLNAKKNSLPADYNDPTKRKTYIEQYISQKKNETQSKYFADARKSAKIEILNPELKAYTMLKDLSSGAAGDQQKKILAVINEFQRAAVTAGDDTQAKGRDYASIAYLYASLRGSGMIQLAKAEQAKYKSEEKTALKLALDNTESNDLRMMLAEISIDGGENATALENLSIVVDNAYDDYQTRTQVLGLYKRIKNGGPKVAALINNEEKWLAENKGKQQQPGAGMPMAPGQ